MMLRLNLNRSLIATCLALFALVTSLSLAAQPAAQKPVKVDAAQLTGVVNFRDIGGYKTADGHTIRYNMLYRSGQLSALTPSDQQKLSALKIRYEIDLRTASERAAAPSHWGPNPPEVIDIPFILRPDATPPQDLARIHAFLVSSYAANAVRNAPTIGAVLHDLAQGDEPALLHCSGGRDRTGMTVAVLMTLLGVSRKDVYREYLLSDGRLITEAQRRQIAVAAGRPYPPSPEALKVRKAFRIDASCLDAFFHSIDTHYGSFHAYVRDGLKLSDADVRNLRKIFLTN